MRESQISCWCPSRIQKYSIYSDREQKSRMQLGEFQFLSVKLVLSNDFNLLFQNIPLHKLGQRLVIIAEYCHN